MIRQAKRDDWRYMAPFFLLIALFLLLVWRFFGPSLSFSSSCPDESEAYRVAKGDTCWDIANSHNVSLEEFLRANQGLACERLRPGQKVCLPNKNNAKI